MDYFDFEALPHDLQIDVLSHLDVKQLSGAIPLTNKKINRKTESVWRHKIMRDFPNTINAKPQNASYKQWYKYISSSLNIKFLTYINTRGISIKSVLVTLDHILLLYTDGGISIHDRTTFKLTMYNCHIYGSKTHMIVWRNIIYAASYGSIYKIEPHKIMVGTELFYYSRYDATGLPGKFIIRNDKLYLIVFIYFAAKIDMELMEVQSYDNVGHVYKYTLTGNAVNDVYMVDDNILLLCDGKLQTFDLELRLKDVMDSTFTHMCKVDKFLILKGHDGQHVYSGNLRKLYRLPDYFDIASCVPLQDKQILYCITQNGLIIIYLQEENYIKMIEYPNINSGTTHIADDLLFVDDPHKSKINIYTINDDKYKIFPLKTNV